MKFFKKDKGIVFRNFIRDARCVLWINNIFLIIYQIELHHQNNVWDTFFYFFDFMLIGSCLTKFIYRKYKIRKLKRYYVLFSQVLMLLSIIGFILYCKHTLSYLTYSKLDNRYVPLFDE